MGPTVADLVARIIDRVDDRPRDPGRPPMPTAEVIETLRFELMWWTALPPSGIGGKLMPSKKPAQGGRP